MRRLISPFWLLELYALLLALLQMPAGVRTDEAKYLLSIPYPHPPLLRSLFASLAWMPQQEFFWRFVLASVLVQGVWLLWDMGSVLQTPRRLALAASWLFSAAFILEAGTVLMAPITALFGLVCVWFALHPRHFPKHVAPLVGCFWFLGLFSAYQTVLYVPLLVSMLRASHVPTKKILLFLGVPFFLLAFYTCAHPLALASLIKVTGQDAPLSLVLRLSQLVWLSLAAGSGMLTIVGMAGILMSRRGDLLITLFLVLAFVFLSHQEYYALLLTPLLVAGVYGLLCKRRLSGTLFLSAHLLMSILFVFFMFS